MEITTWRKFKNFKGYCAFFVYTYIVCMLFVFTADMVGLNFFIDYRYSNFLKSIHIAYVWI